ncbi:hypothetical protein YC2023_124463 [Brassica napus]
MTGGDVSNRMGSLCLVPTATFAFAFLCSWALSLAQWSQLYSSLFRKPSAQTECYGQTGNRFEKTRTARQHDSEIQIGSSSSSL